MFKRVSIALFILFLILHGVLTADGYEFRNYITFNYGLLKSHNLYALQPFVKIETRFRSFGVVQNKSSAGLNVNFSKKTGAGIFYSRKELFYDGYVEKDLFSLDFVYRFHKGIFSFKNRHRGEWHSSDEYVRYRNYSELKLKSGNRFNIFISEEFRIDFDENRINQNDIAVGSDIDISGNMKLRIFIAQESKRRHSKINRKTYYVGLSAVIHILR